MVGSAAGCLWQSRVQRSRIPISRAARDSDQDATPDVGHCSGSAASRRVRRRGGGGGRRAAPPGGPPPPPPPPGPPPLPGARDAPSRALLLRGGERVHT